MYMVALYHTMKDLLPSLLMVKPDTGTSISWITCFGQLYFGLVIFWMTFFTLFSHSSQHLLICSHSGFLIDLIFLEVDVNWVLEVLWRVKSESTEFIINSCKVFHRFLCVKHICGETFWEINNLCLKLLNS